MILRVKNHIRTNKTTLCHTWALYIYSTFHLGMLCINYVKYVNEEKGLGSDPAFSVCLNY